MDNSPVIQLARSLIERRSVTPDDAGCQGLMRSRLEPLGFTFDSLDRGDVSNFWAVHGTSGPLLVFAGHTDVVPAGALADWDSDPFKPEIRDGLLYGRGAADMKGSLAAMLVASEKFIASQPNHKGRLAFLITSDEEGVAVDGTVKVVEHLERMGEKIDWCVVGEPSSTRQVGDVIKNGRRGSLGCELQVQGIQGHVAYPENARNPVHQALAALDELAQTTWDQGNDYFPATTFQISNIHAGTGATNVIPGVLDVVFNFRFSTEVTAEQLQNSVETILQKHGLDYRIRWNLSGLPFLTPPGALVDATKSAVQDVCGIEPQLSTAGGTSDGRFIAPTGAQVIELGPCNATIHKINECVKASDLDRLARIYEKIMVSLLC